jgi:tRNA (cytidine/uridine-2'-O-)-methyltransferase
MFHIVLYEPEIPPNTGNIIRLCANTGACLHLIKPLGFDLDDRSLRRAGLDYLDPNLLAIHKSLENFLNNIDSARLYAISTRGSTPYHEIAFRPDDVLMFGPETRGLPEEVLQSMEAGHILRIPMQPGQRSLNLANAVSIVLYEAWRQNDFKMS